MSVEPICHCTLVDGMAWEDPDHPCEDHHPKDWHESEDFAALEPPC